MKVLLLHNAYQQAGGEDAVVRMEAALLQARDCLAALHVVSNDDIVGLRSKLSTALGVVFSLRRYREVRRLLRQLQPDVVHVHNFFPLLSPSVFYACHAEGVPVVFTLHNYRIVCPTALLMHNGKLTDRSLTEGPWWALRHRVYRGSWPGTLLLCLMIWLHHRMGTWRGRVDRFIVLTEFGRSQFAAAGLPTERLVVKPNFVDLPAPGEGPRSGLLFVGRLSPEKGVATLLQAASLLRGCTSIPSTEIRVAGNGPLASEIAGSDVAALGPLTATEVHRQMQAALALLMPSIWYEGFPMVLVEAYANGLPVIASRIGALAELVEDGVTGLLFEPGNAEEMADRMRWALEHPEHMRQMGEAARQRYEKLYKPEYNYEQLTAIYRNVIAEHDQSTQQT